MVKLLHQTVTAIADATPNHVAFRCGDVEISYADLELQSNQMARLLLGNGAEKGDRIGVFMPRCIESVVAIYGIFKAGCVFVALDPHLAPGTLQSLVQNCQISQLLTHTKKHRVIEQFLDRCSENSLSHIVGFEEQADDPSTSRRRVRG